MLVKTTNPLTDYDRECFFGGHDRAVFFIILKHGISAETLNNLLSMRDRETSIGCVAERPLP
jgi:hypothetical protein